MKLGYWERGGHAMKTHLMDGEFTPACRHPQTSESMVTFWMGKRWLGYVDCGNCLRVYRARLRRRIQLVEQRMAGREAAQADLL